MAETANEGAMKGAEGEHDTKEHLDTKWPRKDCKPEKETPHQAGNRTQPLEAKHRLEDGREPHCDTSDESSGVSEITGEKKPVRKTTGVCVSSSNHGVCSAARVSATCNLGAFIAPVVR